MNKTKIYLYSLLMAAASLNIGCMSTVTDHARSAYNSASRALNNNKPTATDALYSQVKQEDRDHVTQLNHELRVTEQQHVLARLEKQRDELQRERSKVNDEMLKYLTREKAHKVELAKLEAIDRNQLGDKITNIELIADTHVDTLKVQQKRLQLESEVSILDVRIDKLQTQIDTEKNKLNTLASNE